MDDILIYSATLEEHLALLNQVFEILAKNKFFIKKSKCSFAQQKVEYLGRVVSAQGVATEPANVEAVTKWPVPTNLKQLRDFLGLTGYYIKFIAHYGMISKPLTDMLKKNVTLCWSPKVNQAFQLLKQKLAQALVFAMPSAGICLGD
jgi:hypothetical protein